MGWDINITANKEIKSAVIDELIGDLPAGMRCGMGKQTWGWCLAVDLTLEGRVVRLSGSCSMSGEIAEGFAEAVARRLEKRGFVVTVSEMSV